MLLSVPTDVAGLTLALKTCLVSIALSANGSIGLTAAVLASPSSPLPSYHPLAPPNANRLVNATAGAPWTLESPTTQPLWYISLNTLTKSSRANGQPYRHSCRARGIVRLGRFWDRDLVEHSADGTVDVNRMGELPDCAEGIGY